MPSSSISVIARGAAAGLVFAVAGAVTLRIVAADGLANIGRGLLVVAAIATAVTFGAALLLRLDRPWAVALAGFVVSVLLMILSARVLPDAGAWPWPVLIVLSFVLVAYAVRRRSAPA
ncbi:hypothetical protein [Hamadaea tsunoensis]|uniref:hypothetical protein n=1 Tax=Hamadaea tsunoensis TaxID=53368 RepID=UPI00040D0731|nr:hypothetical protein [Hamadaea tsunoensis]